MHSYPALGRSRSSRRPGFFWPGLMWIAFLMGVFAAFQAHWSSAAAQNMPGTVNVPPPRFAPPRLPSAAPQFPSRLVTPRPPEGGAASITPAPVTTPGQVVPNQIVVLHTDSQAAQFFRAQVV